MYDEKVVKRDDVQEVHLTPRCRRRRVLHAQ